MPLRLLVQHLAHVILPTAQGLAEFDRELGGVAGRESNDVRDVGRERLSRR